MNITHNGITLDLTPEEFTELLMRKLRGTPTPAWIDANASLVNRYLVPPAIGEIWTEQGGRYAGLSLTDAGKPCHLIVAEPGCDYDMTWANALKWAKELVVGQFSDFDLPNRHDGLVVFDNLAEHMAKVAHWLKTEYTSDSGYAWCQYFGGGNQNYSRKGYELRARAVRRLEI